VTVLQGGKKAKFRYILDKAAVANMKKLAQAGSQLPAFVKNLAAFTINTYAWIRCFL
jgi:hypothetical protein